ncbi:MAG: type II toxin-antitoxin system VapC family toxin [bacterium]
MKYETVDDGVVLDASALLADILNEPVSSKLETIIEEHRCFSPSLIRYEVANGLLLAYRRDRIASPDPLKIIDQFPIEHPSREFWWEGAGAFNREHRLTFYDATYASMAKELELPLLTLDNELREACEEEGLTLKRI